MQTSRCPRSTLATAILLTLLAGGCSTSAGGQSLPTSEPSIRGVVTDVRPAAAGTGRLLAARVETNPADESGSPKALVAVDPQSRLYRRRRGQLELLLPRELRVGDRVTVWFTGPVLESYPVQATALALVVEES